MSHTARQLFPGWYKRAGYETEAPILKARVDAIDKILEKEDSAFWLDLIKLLLNLRVSGAHVKEFVDFFVTEDAAFPLTDNQNVLRHLAAAVIAILLDEQQSGLTRKVALSIKTATFLKQYDLTDFSYVHLYSTFNLQNGYAFLRANDMSKAESTLATLETAFGDEKDDAVVQFNGGEINGLLGVMRSLLTANNALYEEVDIHWWLFGAYSTEIGKAFSAIPFSTMVFISALELFSLTRFHSALRNSSQYLAKAILSSPGKVAALNLFQVISGLPEEEKKLVVGESADQLTFLTPLLLAVKSSMDVADGDWSIHYKAIANNADIKKEEDPVTIANQLYLELVLLNLA